MKIVFADDFRLTGGGLSFERDNIILLAEERGRELERYGFVFFVAGVGFEPFLPDARAGNGGYRRAVIAVIIAFESKAQAHGSGVGIEPERIRFADVACGDGQQNDRSDLRGRDLRRLVGRLFRGGFRNNVCVGW